MPAVRGHFDEHIAVMSDTDLPAHAAVLDLIQHQIHAVNTDLAHWEQIKTFRLLGNSFSIEGGELTPTLKIKRRVVHQKYKDEIKAMYG